MNYDLGFINLEQKTLQPSTTLSAQGCHPCLRYVPLPMSPVRTHGNAHGAPLLCVIGPGSRFLCYSLRHLTGISLPRGTEDSNPAPSSGESPANLSSSIRALKARWPDYRPAP
jgi:hypothetical protein